jgi:hypothetical protein
LHSPSPADGLPWWHWLLAGLMGLLLLWFLLQVLFYSGRGVTAERIRLLIGFAILLFSGSVALIILQIRRLRNVQKSGRRKRR